MPVRKSHRPRIGIPWRTSVEEVQGRRRAYERYLRAVREAGGEPVEISLFLAPGELKRAAESLDGFVLPGSPADVEPRRFGGVAHPRNENPDKRREHTDDGLLDHALAGGKPVLAICYGVQLLNVHLHGTLVQDIPSEMRNAMDHDGSAGRDESLHPILIKSDGLAELAGGSTGAGKQFASSIRGQAGARFAYCRSGTRRSGRSAGMDGRARLDARCAVAPRADATRRFCRCAFRAISERGARLRSRGEGAPQERAPTGAQVQDFPMILLAGR